MSDLAEDIQNLDNFADYGNIEEKNAIALGNLLRAFKSQAAEIKELKEERKISKRKHGIYIEFIGFKIEQVNGLKKDNGILSADNRSMCNQICDLEDEVEKFKKSLWIPYDINNPLTKWPESSDWYFTLNEEGDPAAQYWGEQNGWGNEVDPVFYMPIPDSTPSKETEPERKSRQYRNSMFPQDDYESSPDLTPNKARPVSEAGLYGKFKVSRNDGSSAPGGKHENCEYFVLDLSHDKHATRALKGYIGSLRAENEYSELREDLKKIHYEMVRKFFNPELPPVDSTTEEMKDE